MKIVSALRSTEYILMPNQIRRVMSRTVEGYTPSQLV